MKIDAIKGAEDELVFWRKFIFSDQFKTWLENKPTPELLPEVVNLIQQERGLVLDVGSGVVSILHGTVPNKNLTATDLLAKEYAGIFDHAAAGAVKPIAIAAEELRYENEFSVVHMRNALDHSQNPGRVFSNLVRAARPGGLVIIGGFENEGSFLRKLGMHQWDISLNVDWDRLTLVSAGTAVDKNNPEDFLDDHSLRKDAVYASIIPLPSGRRWVTWAGRKNERKS